MPRDTEYEAENTIYTEEGYKDIKCKNYAMCKGTFDHRLTCTAHGLPGRQPAWYLCHNCFVMFGIELQFCDEVECPICLETKRGLKQPNCEHKICVDCFRYSRYGIFEEPEFPYSKEVEEKCEEYGDIDSYPPEFLNTYPLLIEYENEYGRRLDRQEEMSTINSRCPLCRK